ncbi:TetR/AcrR family transcriptional regulator [Proteus hauseri]|uniref:TetR/AcrR family transcriptional regulator n=1 Tax=Proteus hauseri TaxID=183417 RepID=UPI0032DA778C
MDIKTHIISTAERIFDQHGFSGTSVDHLAREAQVSTRTFYKHIGGKDALITAVLRHREERFFNTLNTCNIDTLFLSLEVWLSNESNRGCLFLRALGDTGAEIPMVVEVVSEYHLKLHQKISYLCQKHAKENYNKELPEQILILFEGAISSASYLGKEAIHTAHRAALLLIKQASLSNKNT